jgi:hypothetical protein
MLCYIPVRFGNDGQLLSLKEIHSLFEKNIDGSSNITEYSELDNRFYFNLRDAISNYCPPLHGNGSIKAITVFNFTCSLMKKFLMGQTIQPFKIIYYTDDRLDDRWQMIGEMIMETKNEIL